MYQDRTLTCRDCGDEFTFTASEQEFYADKGFTNDPSRCPQCRAARKANGGTRTGKGQNAGRPRRQLYQVVCASCGATTEVPFQPTGDRPVYCRDCYQKARSRY